MLAVKSGFLLFINEAKGLWFRVWVLRFRFVVCYESMKRKLIQNLYMSVGVMEDYKLRDLHASHTVFGYRS